MALEHHLSPLSNPLATVEQLSNSASLLDGVPADLERSLRYHGAIITQAAGILLQLPQDIIAQAVVTFTRFYTGPEGGSFRIHSLRDISAATLYLTAKLSFQPQTTRAVLNAYAFLDSKHSPFAVSQPDRTAGKPPIAHDCTLTEGQYLTQRGTLLQNESLILRSLSFTTHVILPHPLALTYLQTLALIPSSPSHTSRALATRTIALLNTALLSPQLLYLTHQPNALAVAATYLAARETGVKLSEGEWWRVWDVSREELGYLVVGFQSLEGFASAERDIWKGKKAPITVEDVEIELDFRDGAEGPLH